MHMPRCLLALAALCLALACSESGAPGPSGPSAGPSVGPSAGTSGERVVIGRPQPALLPARPPEAAAPAPLWRAPVDPELGASCEDCHADIVESYRRTGMARALAPVHAEEFRGLGEVADEAGFRYRVQSDARGRVALVETHAGAPEHSVSAALTFAIGAGIVDRSYAARLGESLWFSPLEVAGGELGGPRHAALAPGHAMRPGLRFTNPITHECLGCHTDRLPPAAFPLNTRPPASWRPTGIGCGACHGPVEAHRAWQERDLSGDAPTEPDPVLRRDRMNRVQRMSVCAACHLQGDARIALERGRLGTPPPGGDLLEVRAVFVAAADSDEIGLASQTKRLVLSACYTASPEMDCASCHDPHQSLVDPRERERVRAGCLGCHPRAEDVNGSREVEGPACSADLATRISGACVDCHTRRTPVFDVEGVRITDHRIAVRPAPPSAPRAGRALRVDEAPDGRWRRFRWPDVPAPDHVDDPGLWALALYHRGHVEQALAFVDRAPHGRVDGLPAYHLSRGSLFEGAGRTEEAVASYERALAIDPAFGPAALNLGLLLGGLGRGEAGLAVLDRALGFHPLAEGLYRNRAVVRDGLGDRAGAVEDLERAFALLPSAEVAGALRDLAAARGDGEALERWKAEARRTGGN